MSREIELRRHTDADEDALTADGVAAALEIGARLSGGDHLAVSTGAQRATQTPVFPVEDRWRAAYETAGDGALGALREADPELVADDSDRLGAALRRVFDALADGGLALVVGHSPTNEAAVLGLTGEIVAPLAKGAGVSVILDEAGYLVEPVE